MRRRLVRTACLLIATASAACGARTMPNQHVDGEERDGGDVTHDAGDAGACGDPAVRERFDLCLRQTDETSCAAAGGAWRGLPGTPPGAMFCICETGDGDCPCESSEDCRAGCEAPGLGDPGSSDCEAATSGYCIGESPWTGCRCVGGPDGSFGVLCVS